MKLNYLSLFFLSALIFASCCLRGRDDQSISLQEVIVKALPYTENQEVVFISNSGDTIRTTVQSKHEFYPASCAECYCESKNYEIQTYALNQNTSTVFAYILSDASWEPGAQIEVVLGNSFFLLPLPATGKFECDSTVSSLLTCFDSIEIQNHFYRNVFQLDNLNVPDTAAFRILYNADKGLLRMEQKDGRFWEVL